MKSLPNIVISVIMPVYNAAPFLERAVRSALAQSFTPIEIIMVDDASTDATLAVAQGLAERHANVKVISLPENGGPSVARNAAMAAAGGEWLAVLDADDAFMPDHLAGLHAIAVGHRADIVLSNFNFYDVGAERVISAGLAVEGEPFPADLQLYLDRTRPFLDEADWGLLKPMFRTAFLREHAISYPTQSRHGEDLLLMVDALLAGAKVLVSPAATYLYSTRESGWSRTLIDYETMVSHSAALLKHAGIAKDPVAREAVERRIEAITRLSAERRVLALWKDKALARMLAAFLTRSADRRAIAGFAAAKVRKTFSGRPRPTLAGE